MYLYVYSALVYQVLICKARWQAAMALVASGG